MVSRLLKILMLMLVLAMPLKASAGTFDFITDLFEGKKPGETSECGEAVAKYRGFVHTVRICKTDEDCTSIDGVCPLGCKIYFNKLFTADVTKDMAAVAETCDQKNCTYECSGTKSHPACHNNRCVGTTKE